MDFEKTIEKLIGARIATRDSIKAYTESEVEKLEASLDLRLPVVYRNFLLTMGKGAGKFFNDVDQTISEEANGKFEEDVDAQLLLVSPEEP